MPRVETIPEFLKALPEIDLPFAGARGWLLQGEGRQVAFVEFEEDVEVPMHSHEEQWELCVAGQVKLTIGDETATYRAGDSFHVPEGMLHGGLISAGYKAMMIFDAAARYTVKT